MVYSKKIYGIISLNTIMIVFIGLISGNSRQSEIQAQSYDFADREARIQYLKSIPVTRWPEISDRKPMTYDEWKSKAGKFGPIEINLTRRAVPLIENQFRDICIIINTLLSNQITAAIDRYVADLILEGYGVETYVTSGGTPFELRAFLQGRYSAGMDGCLLVGDLPIPWFEDTCWDPPEYCAYPIDLFYMDMDGIWADNNSNGIYDSHTGDCPPEIWVGRLTASPMIMANEVALINNYFDKNHRYRARLDSLVNRSLAYIDDDWIQWAEEWDNIVGLAYDVRTLVSDGAETVDTDYENKLGVEYESILLCSHSDPACHYFKIGSEWTGGITCNDEVVSIDPKAYFYNLYACSNARYVEWDYMAGWYIFCQTHGIAAIGSTKTGSMLNFEYFYGPFGNGKTIGEALRDWFISIGQYGYTQDDMCWFYGMTLCGDPTLRNFENAPLEIVTRQLADGEYGQGYTDTLTAQGGRQPYHWSIIEGVLPPELQLNLTSGIISGIPEDVGVYNIAFRASDGSVPAQLDTVELSLFVGCLCGDANYDGSINVLDVAYIVNYLYKGGPAPIPPIAADADGSGYTNILDAANIISYLYKGGSAPDCF